MSLSEHLRRQSGVISHPQAVSAGLSASAIRRRVAGGQWVRLHPRVYLAADRYCSDEARVHAAVLWAGAGAVVHGPTAAWWHGLRESPPAAVELTLPRTRSLPPRAGVQVRRRDLAEVDVVRRRGLAVTAVALTVLEAAVALGSGGSAFLDRALQRTVPFAALSTAHSRNLGCAGSVIAGRLLAAAADRADSAAERLLITLLRSAGLTGWVRSYPELGYRIDVAFPAARLAIEVDGWAWHCDAERFRADRARQNALVNAGWRVLRFTWHDLTARPDRVVAEIRAALAR